MASEKKITRRRFLEAGQGAAVGIPVGLALGGASMLLPLPTCAADASRTGRIDAAGPESEIMRLFREWDARSRQIEIHALEMSEADFDAACDDLRALVDRIMALPAHNLEEFAAKFLAITSFGDFDFDRYEIPFIREAAALAGVSIPEKAAVLRGEAGAA